MRRVLAIGGGGFSMEATPSPIDDYLLSLAPSGTPRICFLATASGDLPEHLEKFYLSYPYGRCTPSHVAFFRPLSSSDVPPQKCAEHVLNQDVILAGPGNTRAALAVWRNWGLDVALRQAHAKGIVLAGVSAGAMCWFDAALTDTYWEPGFVPLHGLGILTGACGVHHDSDEKRGQRLVAAVEARAVETALAIDDRAAVEFENGRLARVLAWGPNASATAVQRVGERR